ncbi:hypothetical protein ACFLSZ_00165 [Candidatus Bipolaricaulota bacterium]
MRGFASLNKMETVPLLPRLWRGLPWDSWPLVGVEDADLTDEDLSTLDRIAELASTLDEHFEDLRELCQSRIELQSGDAILNYK